ncbi:hypothetical protein ES705_10273 [subsurface metagenome]
MLEPPPWFKNWHEVFWRFPGLITIFEDLIREYPVLRNTEIEYALIKVKKLKKRWCLH